MQPFDATASADQAEAADEEAAGMQNGHAAEADAVAQWGPLMLSKVSYLCACVSHGNDGLPDSSQSGMILGT